LLLSNIDDQLEYYQSQYDQAGERFGDLARQVELLESLTDQERVRAVWQDLAHTHTQEELIRLVFKKAIITDQDPPHDLAALADLRNLIVPLESSLTR
jgi:hypothetical protein